MNRQTQFRQGLQWGAIAWLGYITVQSVRESVPTMFLWILALALLVVGSRWTRGAVALGILGQLAYGLHEASRIYTPEFCADLSTYWTAITWLHRSGAALCLGMIPLVAWRPEGPRVTIALLVLGRWRDAWERSGGAVALLAAAPMVALNRATLDFFVELALAPLALVAVVLVLARYGDVIAAWPAKGRQAG